MTGAFDVMNTLTLTLIGNNLPLTNEMRTLFKKYKKQIEEKVGKIDVSKNYRLEGGYSEAEYWHVYFDVVHDYAHRYAHEEFAKGNKEVTDQIVEGKLIREAERISWELRKRYPNEV